MKNLFLLVLAVIFFASCGDTAFIPNSDSNVGAISGKYKTMTIVGDYMYAVNNSELITIDLTDKANPQEIDKQDVGRDIENIYQNGPALFIGSRTNLHIYALGDNGIPSAKSDTEYLELPEEVRVCDPVVAEQHVAYVTLTTNDWGIDLGCGEQLTINELRTYNVQDLSRPVLMNTYNMEAPMGMSIDGDYLFLADGPTFKVFVMDHSGNLDLIATVQSENYDLIAKDGKLTVVSKDEIRQYDYTDINDIKLFSSISLD